MRSLTSNPRLRVDCLFVDDALKRTFRNAERRPPALRDSVGDGPRYRSTTRSATLPRRRPSLLHQRATTEQPPRMRAAAGPRRA